MWEPESGKKVTATLIDQEEFTKLMKIDDWNDVVIRAEGNRIRHYLNGRLILDFTDADPAKALRGGCSRSSSTPESPCGRSIATSGSSGCRARRAGIGPRFRGLLTRCAETFTFQDSRENG